MKKDKGILKLLNKRLHCLELDFSLGWGNLRHIKKPGEKSER